MADSPFVMVTSPKSGKSSKGLIIAVLIVVFLILSVAAGVLLVRQSQNVQEKASGAIPDVLPTVTPRVTAAATATVRATATATATSSATVRATATASGTPKVQTTPLAVPVTGVDWPTVGGIGIGVAALIFAILLAL